MSSEYDLSSDESGAMLVEVLQPNRDNILEDLISSLPADAVEEIILLNGLREDSGLIKIAAKHKPNNPALWSKCLADAKKRFRVCPSAYCNAFAARTYKKKGGTWKTVKKKGGKK
jgi:hypothetical protein